MGQRLDNVVSVALLLATAVITSSVVIQTVRGGKRGAPAVYPVFEKQWRESLPAALTVAGGALAPITIIEFTDLECPVCREFHAVVMKLILDFPGAIRFMYVPFPLSIHRNAMNAARAADCAAGPGELERWMSVVYDKQDSLGVKSWGSFAAEAELPDTARIARCAGARDTSARVLSGLALGRKLRVNSTPTLLVNGWRFLGAPAEQSLDSLIRALIRKNR